MRFLLVVLVLMFSTLHSTPSRATCGGLSIGPITTIIDMIIDFGLDKIYLIDGDNRNDPWEFFVEGKRFKCKKSDFLSDLKESLDMMCQLLDSVTSAVPMPPEAALLSASLNAIDGHLNDIQNLMGVLPNVPILPVIPGNPTLADKAAALAAGAGQISGMQSTMDTQVSVHTDSIGGIMDSMLATVMGIIPDEEVVDDDPKWVRHPADCNANYGKSSYLNSGASNEAAASSDAQSSMSGSQGTYASEKGGVESQPGYTTDTASARNDAINNNGNLSDDLDDIANKAPLDKQTLVDGATTALAAANLTCQTYQDNVDYYCDLAKDDCDAATAAASNPVTPSEQDDIDDACTVGNSSEAARCNSGAGGQLWYRQRNANDACDDVVDPAQEFLDDMNALCISNPATCYPTTP